MTTNITWAISTLDRNTSDGYITTAHWQATAVDGDDTASIYSTCSFGEGTPTIPYASVTEAEVLNWVWESVDKTATEAALAAKIDALKNPTTATGTPWATE